jgi:hypothetical protein
VVTPVDGAMTLDTSGWVTSAAIGETVILPAGQAATLVGRDDSIVLRGWVPDLEREIMTPARAAGASQAAIRRLGVPMDDMVDVSGHATGEPVPRASDNPC